VVVFILMTVLFHSALWGLLCMIPLTVTIGLIYGLIGLAGKDYDMPVAVLSSLTLGLAVDFAIHFLARSRNMVREIGSWREAAPHVFGEPARAISRNAIVVAVGFLPLLAAPLVPYQTVGTFIALILLTAGVASVLLLPALITVLERWLFPVTRGRALACRCGTCVIASVTGAALIAVSVRQFVEVGWTNLSWVAAAAVVILAGGCWLSSGRRSCRADRPSDPTDPAGPSGQPQPQTEGVAS
jgi:hypothetical protein